MISSHLVGYHLLWFHFEALLFLKNPKIRQPLRRIFKRGSDRTQFTI